MAVAEELSVVKGLEEAGATLSGGDSGHFEGDSSLRKASSDSESRSKSLLRSRCALLMASHVASKGAGDDGEW